MTDKRSHTSIGTVTAQRRTIVAIEVTLTNKEAYQLRNLEAVSLHAND